MESKLECAVTYLQFVDCTLDAAKQTEELQPGTTLARGSLFRPTYKRNILK